MQDQTSRRARFALATTVVFAVLLAACGSNDAGNTGSPQTTVPANSGTAAPTGTGLQVVENGLDADTAEGLEAATRQGHAEISAPGAIVGVRTATGDWIATIGSTELGGTQPMTADMHQRVGSITKTFTSTLLLQSAEKGELSLDDPIEKYVPGMPNPQATLGQLSAMRSGIPSYTFSDAFATAFFGDPQKVWTPEELVGLVKGAAPLFAPGEQWDYSNTNIVLLGMVIEQVTKQPIEKLIDEQIAKPLGLEQTSMPTSAAFPDPHAHGYTVQGQDDRVPVDTTDWNPSWAWTAGGMISTMDDLLTYGRELVVGTKLLGPEMQATRLASMENMGAAPDHQYGYGLQVANGWWGHTGELPGFNSFMYYNEANDLMVVVLVNSDISAGECTGGPKEANTVPGGPTSGPCLDPAVHLADLVTASLGYPGNPADVGASSTGTSPGSSTPGTAAP